MHNRFKMSDLRLLTYYLVIEVNQHQQGIDISYAYKILENNSMKNCNPCLVPMGTKLKSSKKSKNLLVDATRYRSIVENLYYLTHTHLDITYVVDYVSRLYGRVIRETPYCSGAHHAILCKYNQFGLPFPRRNKDNTTLIELSDSDMVGDVDNQKSTTSVSFFLG